MKGFLRLLVVLVLGASVYANSDQYASRVYSKIKDITHPTAEEYAYIQHHLLAGYRPLINLLDDWQYKIKARHFRFLGRNSTEFIECGIIHVNCNEKYKENCVLLYASFNEEYPKGLKNLIEHIKNSDFKGHILYRIGGWPDLEGGSLVFAHIPYAFKICSFKEAERLGYKNVLWLDCSILPLNRGLNHAFDIIKEKGYFTYCTEFNMAGMCNEQACAAMGVSFDEADQIPGCLSGIIGFNFDNLRARQAVDLWYDITKNKEEAYFSLRPELCVMSIVLYKLGLTENQFCNEKVTWDKNEIGVPGMEFFVDKYAVQPNWVDEEDGF